ncbi:L-2-hydroxyglutarate oxidase [Microlunatus elymi]|uniref:L-2-hydroxyglutarate oxidase n=1 Tax=Microlunatus elymi TaxID=2596828 RepID=A0A516Q5L3_9ACTN|nr:L-2-hydroxyglutarate oxidase [Microlunatus elymi]
MGAGVVGLALARRLAAEAEIVVVDKENQVAAHQSGHNSGVVHSGVYYAPGSLKARLCRRGAVLLRDYCRDRNLPHRELGKVIVARDDREVVRLRELQRRSEANQVPGIRWLSAGELTELEPAVRGRAGLHSPSAAIVDFRRVARAYAADVEAAGGRLLLGQAVTSIRRQGDRVELIAGEQRMILDRLIICAGLHSDRLARMAGDERGPMIIAFRGEYYRLVAERSGLVNGLVYPVPDPAYPFLGVHFTPGVDGTVHIGPNAVMALAREGYRRRDVDLADLVRELSWPGTWRLARRHWRAGARELYGSMIKRAYLNEARSYLPALCSQDVVRAPAGVRAQALDADGQLVDDFRISTIGPITAVRNAPSPAATSSLAIAEHIADLLHR